MMQVTGIARRAFVIMMLLLVAACSSNFAYERLDWLVVWRMGKYVSLTDDQKTNLQAAVQAHLDYVRVYQMPAAADILDRTAREIEVGYITAEMVDARYREMLAEFDQFMLSVVPLSMDFLRSLNEEQVAELFENLEEINQEMYADYSGRTPEEREKNRNKSAIKSTQQWTGRLSKEQKQLLKDALARMEDSSEQWIEYQREWQRRFRALIETRPSEDDYREELTELFVYPRDFHSDEYRAVVDANRQIFNKAFAELLTGLTDKQRKRMVRELDDWAGVLRKLSEGV